MFLLEMSKQLGREDMWSNSKLSVHLPQQGNNISIPQMGEKCILSYMTVVKNREETF